MSLLTVYKASAGSGKTFKLTETYLKLIFNPEVKFHSILAVTFTNKATAEMRHRILNELYTLALGKPSAYENKLKSEFKLSDDALQRRASVLLGQILHNYSSFNVSTIDSFFQKILKSFTRETGLGAGFNVELNLKQVLEFGIAAFLDNAQNTPQLKQWLTDYAIQKIEADKSWNIETDIFKFTLNAFNEVFFSFSEEQYNLLADIDNFKRYKQELNASITLLTAALKLIGTKATNLIQKEGLTVADFAFGDAGVAGYLNKLSQITPAKIKEPTSRVMTVFNQPCNPELWHTKSSKKSALISNCVTHGLDELLRNSVDWFNNEFIDFNTANAILKELDVYAVIVEIFNQINAYCRDKNIFLLPLASPFLSKMIGEEDATFIYEKTGEYLRYFMIDEFQDTSKMQWNNFAPLFTNGISQGYNSMVVGDVKQSIYRWRNGDWTLLHHKLAQKYNLFGVEELPLNQNWRSAPEVVTFNNLVFKYLPDIAGNYLTTAGVEHGDNDFTKLVADIYSEAYQVVPDSNMDKKGYVEVCFKPLKNDDADKTESQQWYLNKIIETLKKLYLQNYNPRDIAILVRTGKEGAMVARHLMDYVQNHPNDKENFAFVSNDSVMLGASPVVLLLVALLEFLSNPKDIQSRAAIIYFYNDINKAAVDAAYLFCDFELSNTEAFLGKLPPEFSDNIQSLTRLTLSALVDRLLSIFVFSGDAKSYDKQLPFVHSFQDAVITYVKQNGNKLQGFMEWWNEFGVNTPITLNEEQNAIRIITIHRAKGLEYEAVIIPFADWSLNRLSSLMWCKAPEKFNRLPFVPVSYAKILGKSHFKEDYYTEFSMALIDNLNLLYVAFTRAAKAMFVFAPESDKATEQKNIADVLFQIISNNNDFNAYWKPDELFFSLGELQKANNATVVDKHLEIGNIELNPNRTIKIRHTVGVFYRNDEGVLQPKVNLGSVYHQVMEQIIVASDLKLAIDSMQKMGLFLENEAEKFANHLAELFLQYPFNEWFDGRYKVLVENNLIINKDTIRRPDRVMVSDNETIVVDYKFTDIEKPEHINQVKEYMKYLAQMNSKSIQGFLWYVNQNKLISVT